MRAPPGAGAASRTVSCSTMSDDRRASWNPDRPDAGDPPRGIDRPAAREVEIGPDIPQVGIPAGDFVGLCVSPGWPDQRQRCDEEDQDTLSMRPRNLQFAVLSRRVRPWAAVS